jgi:hypothetical protein
MKSKMFSTLFRTHARLPRCRRDIDNGEVVHLATSATAFSIEEHIEGDDLANKLRKIRRRSCRPVSFQF